METEYSKNVCEFFHNLPRYEPETYCNIILHCPKGRNPGAEGAIGMKLTEEEYKELFGLLYRNSVFAAERMLF